MDLDGRTGRGARASDPDPAEKEYKNNQHSKADVHSTIVIVEAEACPWGVSSTGTAQSRDAVISRPKGLARQAGLGFNQPRGNRDSSPVTITQKAAETQLTPGNARTCDVHEGRKWRRERGVCHGFA
jgi:hypothetical protein